MKGKAQCPPYKYALVSTFRPIKVLMVDFPKKGLDKKVFVVRDEALYFSEALGFSLPSLLVNPALVVVHLRGLAPGRHSSERTSQGWRAVRDTVPTRPTWDLNPRPPHR